MVVFLKDIEGQGFTFKKGNKYVSMDDSCNEELKDKILIKQPNSPKKTNWWASFPKSQEGETFRTLDNCEMSLFEMIEENKALSM